MYVSPGFLDGTYLPYVHNSGSGFFSPKTSGVWADSTSRELKDGILTGEPVGWHDSTSNWVNKPIITFDLDNKRVMNT